MLRLPTRSSLFPYTTLFRSTQAQPSRPRRRRGPPDLHQGQPPPRRLNRQALRQLPSPLPRPRSEEHTSELQSREKLVCRLLLEKKKNKCKSYKRSKKPTYEL